MLVSKYLAITAVSLEIEQCSKAELSMVGIVVSANDGDVISKLYQNHLCPFYHDTYFAAIVRESEQYTAGFGLKQAHVVYT